MQNGEIKLINQEMTAQLQNWITPRRSAASVFETVVLQAASAEFCGKSAA